MLKREDQEQSGGFLCDEMGLGKTIQMLGLIKESDEALTLLVGPLAVLGQWEDAAKRCGFQVWVTHPTKKEWVPPSDYDPMQPSIFLINYERACYRQTLVLDEIWSRVIFDEAHKIGNSKTNCYRLAKKIKAAHKWFLTATPITNKIENAIALFKLLGHKRVPNTIATLKPLIASSVLCRKMADLRDVIPSLPQSAKGVKHSLDFDTEEEAEFYRGIQGAIQKRWKILEEESAGQMERFRLIMRLRQISIHPQVYIAARKKSWPNYKRDDFLLPSTKFTRLSSLIEEESNENHRWLVFCHFREEMEMLQAYLQESPVVRECGVYNGSLSSQEREDVIEVSKEPLVGIQQEVLLVQLQSGGVGLNLQHFDRIVFMGPWWTAAIMDQAIGRAVRIGQTKQVIVHHLVLKEEETMNIDVMMLEKAEMKRSLCDAFLGEAEGQSQMERQMQEKEQEKQTLS